MNLYKQLLSLLPQPAPLLIAEVVTHHGDGTSTVETFGGGLIRVRGQAVGVGLPCYIQGEELIGPAPELVVEEVYL